MPDDVERQLREMSDTEWDALTARLRAPDAGEALRSVASKYISGERLEAICALMPASVFVNEAGEVDEARVAGLLRGMFPDIPPAQAGPRWQDHGQHSPEPPSPGLGDRGRAAAEKRFHGVQPATGSSGALAAVEKRFGKRDGRSDLSALGVTSETLNKPLEQS